MNKIKANILFLYLVLYRKYSVMRVCEDCDNWNGVWSACNKPMEEGGGHNGTWAEGSSPQMAAYNCYSKAKRAGREHE